MRRVYLIGPAGPARPTGSSPTTTSPGSSGRATAHYRPRDVDQAHDGIGLATIEAHREGCSVRQGPRDLGRCERRQPSTRHGVHAPGLEGDPHRAGRP